MQRSLPVIIFLTALILFSSGCTALPAPTATPIPATPIPPTIAPTATPIHYDGFWEGGTNDGQLSGALEFVIENNKVTEILFNYTLRSGGCTYISAFSGTADESFIKGNEIHATLFIQGGNVFTFNGTFIAPEQAEGTLTYKGNLQDCGAFEKTVKWNANNLPFPPTLTPPPLAPTETPTLTPTAARTLEPTPESNPTPDTRPTIPVNAHDTRFPLPNDVQNFTRDHTYREQINYQTGLMLDAILEFYRGALSKVDVIEDTRMTTTDAQVISVIFIGWAPNKWLVLQAVDLGELRNVNLRLENAR